MLSIRTITKLTALVLGFISLVGAGEKEGESNIELIPVYEKTFDDTIVDVIFDTATVTIEEAKKMGWQEEGLKKIKGGKKTKIIYPKVVITRKKEEGKAYYHYTGINRNYGTDDVRAIKFYNKTGKFLKTIDAGIFKKAVELLRSPNGRYFCIAKWPAEFGYYDYRGGDLYDADGRMIWQINTNTPIAISDEGYAIATYVDWDIPPAPGGKFYVYNNKGELIRTIENPDTTLLVARFAKFSDDGEWAIVAFKKETFPPTHLTLIKKSGEIVWEKLFPECRITARGEEVTIIPYIGVCGIWDYQLVKGTGGFRETEVYFIDWQGNLKWTTPLGIRGNMIVNGSGDGDKIYVASAFGYLWCIDIQNGKIIWTHKESWAPELRTIVKSSQIAHAPMFREMKIITDKICLIGETGVFSVFYSKNGDLLKRMEFLDEKISLPFTEQYLPLIKGNKGQVVIFNEEDLR